MPNNAISKRLKEVSARHSATCAGGSAGSTAAAAAAVAETFQEVSLYRSDKCSAKSAESTAAAVKVAEMQCDARGVILASRDGSSVFIDTHPPYDGHLSDGIGRARASRNTVVAAEIVLPPRVLDGFGSSCSALSTVHSAGGNGVVAARGSPGGFEGEESDEES